MSGNPIDRDRVPAALAFVIPIGPKLRRPSTFVTLPPEFLSYLGQIAVLWGMFETSFEELLEALLKANVYDEKRWQGFSFEQKVELFKRELKKLFWCYPRISLYISQIINDAKSLQAKRNLLLHGNLIIEIKTKDDVYQPPDIAIVAVGRRKKQKIVERFTLEVIENLFFDLCHLGGRMAEFAHPSEKFVPHVAWQDRCFLLDFLKNNHPAHTNPHMPPPPPGAYPT